MSFKQRRLALRIESEILPFGVRYREQDLFGDHDTVVPFEHISDQLVSAFRVSKLYLAITLGLLLLLVFNVYDYLFQTPDSARVPATGRDVALSFAWFAIAATGTWMRSVRYYGIVCTGTSLVFFDGRGRDDPRDYVRGILAARNAYLEFVGSQAAVGAGYASEAPRPLRH